MINQSINQSNYITCRNAAIIGRCKEKQQQKLFWYVHKTKRNTSRLIKGKHKNNTCTTYTTPWDISQQRKRKTIQTLQTGRESARGHRSNLSGCCDWTTKKKPTILTIHSLPNLLVIKISATRKKATNQVTDCLMKDSPNGATQTHIWKSNNTKHHHRTKVHHKEPFQSNGQLSQGRKSQCKTKQVHVKPTFTHHTPLLQEHRHNYGHEVEILAVYVTNDNWKSLQPLNTSKRIS